LSCKKDFSWLLIMQSIREKKITHVNLCWTTYLRHTMSIVSWHMCHWNITFPEPLWVPLFHWCHVTPLVHSMCWKDVLCKVITTFSVRNWYWIFQNLTHDHHAHGSKWFPMHPIFHLCSNFLFTTLHRWGDDVLKTEILNYGHKL
jgi:hypothetical protein